METIQLIQKLPDFFLAAFQIFWKTSRLSPIQVKVFPDFLFIFQNNFSVCFCLPDFHNRIICFFQIATIQNVGHRNHIILLFLTIHPETSFFFPGSLPYFLEDFQIVFNLSTNFFQIFFLSSDQFCRMLLSPGVIILDIIQWWTKKPHHFTFLDCIRKLYN